MTRRRPDSLGLKIATMNVVCVTVTMVALALHLSNWGYGVMFLLFLLGLVAVARADFREFQEQLDRERPKDEDP